jgi:pimeloyl-ACP methyl ester carboxylesterase
MPAAQKKWVWTAAGGAALAALAASGTAAQRRHTRGIEADPAQARLNDPPSGRPLTVHSADGTMLCAEAFGSEDGAPVVLAHGWTETLSFWTYVMEALSKRGFRVVAYDQRGHGRSEPAIDHDYEMARFGEDLEAVLEACLREGERAIVAGHSLGAMSIAAWADDHDVQRRARGAALINAGVDDLIAQQLILPLPAFAQVINKALAVRGFLGSRTPLPRVSTPASHAVIRYFAFGPDATAAQIAFYERMLVATPPDARASTGIAMSEMDLRNALRRLTVATAVIAGEDDRLTPPSHARRIANMVPRLERLTVLPDTGHMAPLERPAELVRAIEELASRQPARPAHHAGVS